MSWRECCVGVTLLGCVLSAAGRLQTEDDESGIEDSSEHLGASVTTAYRHPYAASIRNRDVYNCSAVLLNEYWLLTSTKCFDDDLVTLYYTQKNLQNYTVRVGSNFNNKGGVIYKVRTLINNFDLKVSAVKVDKPIAMGELVEGIQLPAPDSEPSLGFSATMMAWTPSGHLRVVSAPVVDPLLCETFTRQPPGHYVCVGGVQDPNRHFCRRDNGGAVVQNNTLIGLTSFLHTCALYSKPHAFPKVSSFARWLDSVIWDENNRPTSERSTVSTQKQDTTNATESSLGDTKNPYYDAQGYMLTLPFDPIDVPLEPNGMNSVLPRMSLYESYLYNLQRSRTSTSTVKPNEVMEDQKRLWLEKINSALMMMPPPAYAAGNKDPELYDYNN